MRPPSQFSVGERVTYYPPQAEQDNLHYVAEVIALTPKRVRIAFPGGRRTVSSKRLTRQGELEV